MRYGEYGGVMIAAIMVLAPTAAAPAVAVGQKARLRVLYPDQITTDIWLDTECAGDGRGSGRRIKVSGGMLRWLAKSRRIGIAPTLGSEHRPTTNIFTKSVIKEFAIPAGVPIVVEMTWTALASNGIATYAQNCKPAPLLFTPRPGQDYETGIRWRAGLCTGVVAFVASDSDATREATPLPADRSGTVDALMPTVRIAQPCPKA